LPDLPFTPQAACALVFLTSSLFLPEEGNLPDGARRFALRTALKVRLWPKTAPRLKPISMNMLEFMRELSDIGVVNETG